jgi:uncharacterized protein (TIGR03435 family)
MVRQLVMWVLALAVSTSLVYGQSEPVGAAFDVASVKRHSDAVRARGSVSVHPGGRFLAPSATVRELIAAAYGTQDALVVGGPEWLAQDRFEVMATTSADVAEAAAREMLKTLLAERFRFEAHVETRELPVYELVPSREDRRPGPQLRPSGPECAPMNGPPRGIFAPGFVPAPPPPPAEGGPLVLDTMTLGCPSVMVGLNGIGHWSIRGMTLARFAERLTFELGRPVIDRSGLAGTYDVDLTFGSDATVLAVPLGEVPPLRTALRDQLGLALESARAPVDVLVIDRAEAPTEN